LLEAFAGWRPCQPPFVASVALLTQQPVILPGTIRENLQLNHTSSGASDQDEDAEYWRVLDAVELTNWAQGLPRQLDTPMGEHPPLSGGQAQRLALARVLLSRAQVWLLDEPTAHLPSQQHHQLSALIKQLGQDKTLLWATHKDMQELTFDQHWMVANSQVTRG
jgi:ATP-binding cassette subfamily C protein CydD